MRKSKQRQTNGRITQIIGPVIDATFPIGTLPNIYNSLVIRGKNARGQDLIVTCEVQQLLGDKAVRTVAINATEGLIRGIEIRGTLRDH